ncbi:MAG: Rrf2 family transcriptional regulator [Bdellovibrionota bacterium]
MLDQRFYMSVHLMTSLAFQECQEGKLSTSEQLAKGLRTNPAVVRRLVAKLVAARLLKAYKGKKGGVELARCPDEITLGDIYEASQDQPRLRAPDKRAHRPCPVSCAMGGLMGEIFGEMERKSLQYLRGITLANLRSRVKA